MSFAFPVMASASSAQAAGAKAAPDLIKSYKWLSTQCVVGPSNTSRATVKVRMRVVNHSGLGGDWASHMKLKARLVRTGAGSNLMRSWETVKSNYLTTDFTHTRIMTVTTDSVSALSDWKVQLKLIWVRPAHKDVVVNLEKPFTTCSGELDWGS